MEEKTKKKVDELREIVKGMSIDMRLFSLTMRSLYAERAVGTAKKLPKSSENFYDSIATASWHFGAP